MSSPEKTVLALLPFVGLVPVLLVGLRARAAPTAARRRSLALLAMGMLVALFGAMWLVGLAGGDGR